MGHISREVGHLEEGGRRGARRLVWGREDRRRLKVRSESLTEADPQGLGTNEISLGHD